LLIYLIAVNRKVMRNNLCRREDAVTPGPANQRRNTTRTVSLCALALLAWAVGPISPASAQRGTAAESARAKLEQITQDVNARLIGLERAQGVLYGALIAGKGQVNEADVFQRMSRRLADAAASARPDAEADKGFAALGGSAGTVIRRAYAFQREVVTIFASSAPKDRKAALESAVERYRSRPELSLPDAPKDMTILYDHPYTSFVPPTPPATEPGRKLAYPTLTGFAWSAHWYELAVLQPFETVDDTSGRDADLATVADRLKRKLSFGTAPDAFPTELPLAPAIAPGLVALHERAAAIIDNLNMMQDVITDVLVRRDVANPRAIVSQVVVQFTDRQYRCVQDDEWIVVALRHSIFDQGGPAVGSFPQNERNAFSGGHGQHYAVRRAPPPCSPE